MDHSFGYYDKYGVWQHKCDVYPREGESRQWADNLLKKGIKMLVGCYSIVDSKWIYVKYTGKLPRNVPKQRRCR